MVKPFPGYFFFLVLSPRKKALNSFFSTRASAKILAFRAVDHSLLQFVVTYLA